MVEISQNFAAFSEYMNFNKIQLLFTGREKHTGLWKGSHPPVFVSKYQWGWLRSFCQYCQKFQWYCVWKHLIRHTYGYDWIFHCFYVCHLFFGRLQLLTKSGKNSHISLFKVHVYWEDHKILQNLPLTFDYSTYSQK